ncbi:glutaredoxin family protein [Desulfovibrio mangrovi]|uniref:glutaredoxin family protein n=1 Tax=Desulfovibrio mangrovi TaxID=2976983 RepID=UPI002247FDC5|nr:glutaredoxin family protein [Desulfovibrio mangrovi]UZP67317.1 glutaredoxin family protein [Desulfovibrio mangrovi]
MAKPCNVTLYALSTCIHCKKTKQFLEDNDVQFKVVYVDQLTGDERKEAIARIKEYNPKLSFPTIIIDEGVCVIVGFQKEEIQEALDI